MIEHTIDIEVSRHDQVVPPTELARAIQDMREYLSAALKHVHGVGGHLSYRWETASRTLTGNLMMRAWRPGDPLPDNTRMVSLIGRGFDHTIGAP